MATLVLVEVSRGNAARERRLPTKFDLPLHHSVSDLVSGIPEVHSRSGLFQVAIRVKLEAQARIAAGIESAQRVIQEVIAREPELHLLAFGIPEDEVLGHRKIAVEISRSGHGWEDIVALLAWRRKGSKTTTVYVLVSVEPVTWVTD